MTAADTNRGKRIAKNTLMLYFRMLFMLFLGLFTSRIVNNISVLERGYAVFQCERKNAVLLAFLVESVHFL